jgi:hypothetical protein
LPRPVRNTQFAIRNTETLPDAYPPEVRHRRRVAAIWDSRMSGTLALATCVTAMGVVLWDWSIYPAAIVGALFVMRVLGAVGDRFATDHEHAQPRIVPYFPEKSEGPDTFFSGWAIARNCLRLDQLAEAAGVRPLSSFGFEDALYDRSQDWHPTADGLATCEALLAAVRASPESMSAPEPLLEELEKLRDRLMEANRANIPFCLHLRTDAAYTAHEFDSRPGKY